MPARTVAVLGSTGSIGTQALEVIRPRRDAFRVVALAAGGGRPELVIEQAREFGVAFVAVADDAAAGPIADALPGVRVEAGERAAAEAAAVGADVVLNGMTGSVGLAPTLAALRAGSTLALANKESLVAGGALVLEAMRRPDQIVPVDSEHSALAQALRGGARGEVRRLVLTASGGPFRGRARADLAGVTPEQALRHPTWDMGPVVTINSATLVNKALEVIEAHLLFGVEMDAIDVVVHPQSQIHSMVEFVDGSTLAQASPPDMRLPIALALSWPDRLTDVTPAYDWTVPHDVDVRAARRVRVPGRPPRAAGRRGLAPAPGRLQRRERGRRRRLPRGNNFRSSGSLTRWRLLSTRSSRPPRSRSTRCSTPSVGLVTPRVGWRRKGHRVAS